MSKPTKKKRNKPYRGEDASAAGVNIRRYSAVQRNPLQQWWFDKKKILKPLLIAVVGVAVFIWLVIETFTIIF